MKFGQWLSDIQRTFPMCIREVHVTVEVDIDYVLQHNVSKIDIASLDKPRRHRILCGFSGDQGDTNGPWY